MIKPGQSQDVPKIMILTSRKPLYPPIEPHFTTMLDVGDGHQVYVEECGREDGLPALALHGGPGGGSSPLMRRFFDPKRFKTVLFDQRGCGRSVPFSDLSANTTAHLIDDIEKIRQLRGIEKWVVYGGSWGSTLALAYARAHPDRIHGLILRGVFLGSQAELDWFYRDGANVLFPDAWDQLTLRLTSEEREDVLAAYHKRLLSDDITARTRDADAWASWETALIALTESGPAPASDPRNDAIARIETHYFVNKCFFERDAELLLDVDRYNHLPGVIIQGRYDVITPARTSWALSKAWPKADYEFIPDAGHSAAEPGVADAIMRAADAFARELG